MSLPLRIRRTVTIPVIGNGENILAIIDVGGKVENKNWVYEEFFILAAKLVKAEIIKKLKAKGKDEKALKEMLAEADKKIRKELIT